MRVVDVDEEILQILDIDTRAVFPGALTESRAKISGRTAIRRIWVIRVHPEGSYYYDRAAFSRSRETFPAIAHSGPTRTTPV